MHDLLLAFVECSSESVVELRFGDEKLDPHLLSLEQGRKVIGIIEERSAAFGTKFTEAGDAIKVI